MSTQRYRCVAEVPCRSGRLAAVLGVLEDALTLGLAGLATVPEGDLDRDLVLAHELVADGAADGGDDVLLGVDSLGLLDGVCHDGRLLGSARDGRDATRRVAAPGLYVRQCWAKPRGSGLRNTPLPCPAVPRHVV